ncbi:MAG TPA: alpha-amylase family glycosyl hydrolase [Ignavibacteriaceae bacterium]|nr:alpha-amylase family glycosyl hydrolase [Ignavibacteriaceae bacterium]
MTNKLGAWQIGDDSHKGKVQFKIFFPNVKDPQIKNIRVAGDFQNQISTNSDWDFSSGFELTKNPTSEGTFWTYTTENVLQAGFYQYKYYLTFIDGTNRIVSDPCARYGGINNQNAAFVIGGSRPVDNIVNPLKNGRKHLRHLNIYELNIDDFTAEYRVKRAPLEAVTDKLDYIKELGFNAILFMPWTAWKNLLYDWGYEPFLYFAVEYRYANDLDNPSEKISWLKKLVNACHEHDIHVIMDGVYNHVSTDFPYKQMYLNPDDCPYTGVYGGSFPGLQDLDFNNECTNEFIRDVCFYWIDTFKIDGIRFDNTVNYYIAGNPGGLPRLLESIENHIHTKGEVNFSLTLEHINVNAASLTNSTKATSFWDNSLYEYTFNYLWHKKIDSRLLNSLNNQRFLNSIEKIPTLYIGNHDHSQVAWQAGAQENIGSMRWYKTQPYLIALFTATGLPMIQNGAEFAEDYWIPENDEGTGRRIRPRPLRWKLETDGIGTSLKKLYKQIANIRLKYSGLRSANFYPQPWEEWQNTFNSEGYGIDVNRQLLIYHRWGDNENGILQRFIIVLNFSDTDQDVCVPFPENGIWVDLLSDFNNPWTPSISDWKLCFKIGSNWGHVFFK